MKYVLALLPSFLSVSIRRLLGAKIGKNCKIKFGTVLSAKKLVIGNNVRIGPFTYIMSEIVEMGDDSSIKYLVAIRCKKLKLGQYATIEPYCFIKGELKQNSRFLMGDHSLVCSFCLFETGEGIEIGNKVGIGGNSLMFTHGNWSDFLNGGPIALGSIIIEDNVWIPWRVFILPNVVIGKDSIVGANSLVNESIPPNSMAVGTPAMVVRRNILGRLSASQKAKRAKIILHDFKGHLEYNYPYRFADNRIVIDDVNEVRENDILFVVNLSLNEEDIENLSRRRVNILNYPKSRFYIINNKDFALIFRNFLSSYGIKLYLNFI